MSSKNKLGSKYFRRGNRDCEDFPRTPVSEPVPAAIATKILTNPKYKVNARIRRKLAARRVFVVEVPRTDAKHPAVKLALRLQKLSLEKLHRRLAQSARRASTVKELLSDMVPGSQFAAGLEAEHVNQLSIFKQVEAEIFSRK